MGCQLFNYTAENDSLPMDSFGDNNQFNVTRVDGNGISRLWFAADQNDASVRTVYCVNEDAPYTRCFPSNDDLLLCRRLRVISSEFITVIITSQTCTTRSIGGCGAPFKLIIFMKSNLSAATSTVVSVSTYVHC